MRYLKLYKLSWCKVDKSYNVIVGENKWTDIKTWKIKMYQKTNLLLCDKDQHIYILRRFIESFGRKKISIYGIYPVGKGSR